MRSSEALGWRKSCDSELHSLKNNKVYSMVDMPHGKKAVKSKWVLRRKLKADGELDKLKARMVAKVSTQPEGTDYDQNFSLIVREHPNDGGRNFIEFS